ncbi:MAG: 4Fe-4S binding protein [Deltaproteobacteria bacterium]|nr:4Fe-4S binding protein [Deltaproteobacteria bacterium]
MFLNKRWIMGTHYITEDCTDCGACDDICPVDSIKWQ